jgi:hypothetical protein
MADQTQVSRRIADLSTIPHLTLDVSRLVAARQAAAPRSGGGGSAELMFFGRIFPDANPGPNILTIIGLPANTRVASAWMTEWTADDNSHVGDAVFYTESVQLDATSNTCRVLFYLDWGNSLPSACMCIFGLFEGDVNIDA